MDSANQQLSVSEKRAVLKCKDEVFKDRVRQEKECLESLKEQKEEIIQRIHEARADALSHENFLQSKAVNAKVEETEKEWQMVAQKKLKVKKLQEEIIVLKERREQALKEVEKMAPYHDLLEKVIKTTKFESVQAFLDHFETLIYSRDLLSEKERNKFEEIDQKRQELHNMRKKHQVAFVHNKNQLSQLRFELEKYRSESQVWEQKWGTIQDTAAQKTLNLGQIKTATLNLYEIAGGPMGEDGMDINDTKSQLEEVTSFIQDREEIVKQFQLTLPREKEE